MAPARIPPLASTDPETASQLLPVLPLEDVCLLPGASLSLVLDRPASVTITNGAAGHLHADAVQLVSAPR